jgi:rSAM/selenodomain-associated transferase 1
MLCQALRLRVQARTFSGISELHHMDIANRLPRKPGSAEGAATIEHNRHRTVASCGVAIMAKASAPGRTKTRLVPPLTFEQAAALNTAFLQDVAGNLLLAASYAPIAGYVAFAPAGAEEFFEGTLPSNIGLIDAWLPNLGDCLLRTIEEIFARGHASAVVLNSDSPTLPTALLVEAAGALAPPGERAVLGPSTDGGYYLLGLKTAHHRLFEEITWGTERVAAQTLERARELELDVHMLPPWYDVDDVEGLRRLQHELKAGHPGEIKPDPHTPHYPAATATLMRSLAPGALAGQRESDPQIPLGSV